MYTTMLFFNGMWFKESDVTAEGCLKKLQEKLPKLKSSKNKGFSLEAPTLTYKPLDGTVYHNFNHIPCGVIFREGYKN